MAVKKNPQVPKPPKPEAREANLIAFDDEKLKNTPKTNAFEDF